MGSPRGWERAEEEDPKASERDTKPCECHDEDGYKGWVDLKLPLMDRATINLQRSTWTNKNRYEFSSDPEGDYVDILATLNI